VHINTMMDLSSIGSYNWSTVFFYTTNETAKSNPEKVQVVNYTSIFASVPLRDKMNTLGSEYEVESTYSTMWKALDQQNNCYWDKMTLLPVITKKLVGQKVWVWDLEGRFWWSINPSVVIVDKRVIIVEHVCVINISNKNLRKYNQS
jgi:hypothetical protein